MYFNHRKCRACGNDNLVPVLDLGIHPMPNDFQFPDSEQAGYAPLKVLYCDQCTLAQLSNVIRPEILYRQYPYVTSRSDTMTAHLAVLCKDIFEEQHGSVIEIGSNDGRFLKILSQYGFGPVRGVDPAQNLCETATREGLSVVCGTWNEDTAKNAAGIIPSIDVIIARHVFCHIDDWTAFISACDRVAYKNTLICIEVPYVQNTLQKCELDTIYHEHLSYFTLKSVEALLANTNWHIHRVNRYTIHGGAVLVMLRHDDYTDGLSHASVDEMIKSETEETTGRKAWSDFNTKARLSIDDLRSCVMDLAAQGKSIGMFGASAKSTVWLNACGIASEEWIDFITDTTPEKIGRLSPGTNIPIVSETELMNRKPDYMILTAWNFREECLAKLKPYIKSGGKVIIPVPALEIVEEV